MRVFTPEIPHSSHGRCPGISNVGGYGLLRGVNQREVPIRGGTRLSLPESLERSAPGMGNPRGPCRCRSLPCQSRPGPRCCGFGHRCPSRVWWLLPKASLPGPDCPCPRMALTCPGDDDAALSTALPSQLRSCPPPPHPSPHPRGQGWAVAALQKAMVT